MNRASTKSRSATTEQDEDEMPHEHLHKPFIELLKDTYDAEKQLVKALPKMEKAATCPKLKELFGAHLKETVGHVQRIEQVFESIEEKPKTKHCPVMEALIEEGGECAKEEKDPQARDAALIAAAQKVEHYEIAAYGTLKTWAGLMDHDDAAELLEATLEEEKAADEKLTAEAEDEENRAPDDDDSDEDDEEEEEGE